jgi:serine-threonine kinase receptor-associated protein
MEVPVRSSSVVSGEDSGGRRVLKMNFSAIPSSLEVSRDGSTLTVTHGNVVSFWDAQR